MNKSAFIHPLALSLVLLLGTAVAQSEQSRVEALEQQVSHLSAQLQAITASNQVNTVLLGNSYLTAAQFHAIDDAINAGNVDPRYVTTVRDTITAVSALAWPAELSEPVDEFLAAAEDLVAALESQDLEAAGAAAAATHEVQHEIGHAVLAFVGRGHDDPGANGGGSAVQAPEGAFELRLELGEQGGVAGAPVTYAVQRDDTVALFVDSAVAGALHLHGYDLEWHVAAGERLTATFETPSVGRFPFEFHSNVDDRGVVVGYLEVRP